MKGKETTGLTSDQASVLLKISMEVVRSGGHDVNDPEAFFKTHLSGYLSGLATETELVRLNRSGKEAVALRRDSLRALGSYLGRPPKADDLLDRLKDFKEIDSKIADAIRKDIERLS